MAIFQESQDSNKIYVTLIKTVCSYSKNLGKIIAVLSLLHS